MLGDGLHDVPPGKIAAVVTHLEMRQDPGLRPEEPLNGLHLRAVENPDLDWYRGLFRAVGGNWLWFSRLRMSDAQLAAAVHDPNVLIWTLSHDGIDAALLELDFRQAGACELAFLGVTPQLIGTGAGRFLMNFAIREAWARPISRVHVHTCTLDSPRALDFYRRAGFDPVRQQVEIADDPRLTGLLQANEAPHVPLLQTR